MMNSRWRRILSPGTYSGFGAKIPGQKNLWPIQAYSWPQFAIRIFAFGVPDSVP